MFSRCHRWNAILVACFLFIALLIGCKSLIVGAAKSASECGNKRIEKLAKPITLPSGAPLAREWCDDGNLKSGDGCDKNCRQETSWYCWQVMVDSNPYHAYSFCTKCGNGRIETHALSEKEKKARMYQPNVTSTGKVGEMCDDGNTKSGDGCDSICLWEQGWTCPKGKNCFRTPVCGNGVVERDETCDDGNKESGDGCDGWSCALERGWTCDEQGRPCTRAR